MQNAKRASVLLLFSLGFMSNFMRELSIFNIFFKGASWYPPSRFLPNPPITQRDNQAYVAAPAFIATLLF